MKTRTVICASFLCLIAALTFGAVSAQERVLTPELILSIKNIADVQLSPDAGQIVFQVSRHRRDDEGPGTTISEIWIMPSKGGQPTRFTYNERSDRAPQWSPNGKGVAFIAQRGASQFQQIFLISPEGGEARQLSRAENSVQGFKWSPDGNTIAYMMTDPKTKDEQQAEREGKDWFVADQNYKHTRLYVLDVKTTESKLVTKSPVTIHDFDWSPDGRQFILASSDTPTVDDTFMRQKLMVISVDGGEMKLLVKTEGKLGFPRWSPDGQWITWAGATSLNDPYPGSVFLVSSGGGTSENLLKGYEGTATSVGWLPGSPSTIVFTSIERQVNALYAISLPDRKRTPLTPPGMVYGPGPSFSRDGKHLALAANTPQFPNEIFFGEAANKPLTRLTTLNPQLADLKLGAQEIVKWKSVDGLEVEGVVVKPVGYEKGKRYPTVLAPHGGPESADMQGWMGNYVRWGQMLAGRGFVTLYPNYRGSIGRGVDYSKSDHRDLMGKEFEDMMTGLDYLIQEGITDPDRIGVGGGSYGGYTSAWATTSGSKRFKAAIAWMGITNWYSMTGVSEIFFENSTVHWDLMMYDNFGKYWERSPIAHIKEANTPTLIIHGTADTRVPYEQSQELYTALKWKGVPVEFVSYPREGHGVAEKAHQLDFMKRVLAWYEKYLR